MAGIGFELRKLYREKGLINNVKAYTFSALTTIGPMMMSMFLIIALQRIMSWNNGTYLDWELYIATVQYAFIFSIIITSGVALVLTRFLADMIFLKKYDHLLSSYYGAIMICLPIGAVSAFGFLSYVSASFEYKLAAYFFFVELVIVWIQAVYMSALKDYLRIVRSFALATIVSLLSGWLLLKYSGMNSTTSAIIAIDIGFIIIVLTNSYHFEHIFRKRQYRNLFEFLAYFRKYPTLFFIGTFFYSGIYIHSFVYWLSDKGYVVRDAFRVSPFYDLPVFYAFISVIPTLVTFVVAVETSFYEKFRLYYKNVLEGGTYQEIKRARMELQQVLRREISFLMEIQLVFTIISIGAGMILLPRIGFTMEQTDAFGILALGYFLFIIMFILLHILLYFDDRKGVFAISSSFVGLNVALTYVTLKLDSDGLGMFVASLLALIAAIARLIYVVRNIDYYTFCQQPIHTRPKASKKISIVGKPTAVAGVIALIGVLMSACSNSATNYTDTTEPAREAAPPILSKGIAEDKRIYENDVDGSLKTLYVTVLPDKASKKDPVDWYGLNRLTDRYSEEKLKIIMQEGKDDGSGPAAGMFGYGDTVSNGTISLRGNTARYASQKSYKIRLSEGAGLWLNQRTINLNKHPFDLTRLRNKLSFDLMEQIPNFTSLRTQFVHLYVKDLTEPGGDGKGFQDYGLYTQIEQPNEMFLKSHWLDPYGELYKVAYFEFFRYPDSIKSQNDPNYDKKAFEMNLEIKGREDHDKLISMLEDVNDKTIPIDDVMEKHFDLDNYLTWLAVNILMDNMDTNSSNFYLYSPLNSDKFYFLPWDYDGAWGEASEYGSNRETQSGISNYWGSVLHNRFFRSEAHVQLLKDKIDELHKIINKETVTKQMEKYQQIVTPFLYRAPDINFLPGTLKKLEDEMREIPNTPDLGIKMFLEDLEKPKPFFLNDIELEDGKHILSWDLSFDLQGDDLTYEVAIATDPEFHRIVKEQKGLTTTEYKVEDLPPGTYYWKTVARDSKGNSQIAFDRLEDEDDDDKKYYGIRQFEVENR